MLFSINLNLILRQQFGCMQNCTNTDNHVARGLLSSDTVITKIQKIQKKLLAHYEIKVVQTTI